MVTAEEALIELAEEHAEWEVVLTILAEIAEENDMDWIAADARAKLIRIRKQAHQRARELLPECSAKTLMAEHRAQSIPSLFGPILDIQMLSLEVP